MSLEPEAMSYEPLTKRRPKQLPYQIYKQTNKQTNKQTRKQIHYSVNETSVFKIFVFSFSVARFLSPSAFSECTGYSANRLPCCPRLQAMGKRNDTYTFKIEKTCPGSLHTWTPAMTNRREKNPERGRVVGGRTRPSVEAAPFHGSAHDNRSMNFGCLESVFHIPCSLLCRLPNG